MFNVYKDLVKAFDGPSRLEIMKEHQYMYKQFENKSNSYDKFRKLVAQNITLPWIKGYNWMGGISDSAYQKGFEKIAKAMGEEPDYKFFDKVDAEFVKQQKEVDKFRTYM